MTELASFANYLTKEKSLDQSEARKKADECRTEMAALKAEMNAVKDRLTDVYGNVVRDVIA